MALDGKWATGKTHFLRRWVSAHRNENMGKGNVIYYDAFANDYQSDPLISLVCALSEKTPESDALRKLKNFAFNAVQPLARR